MSNLRNRAPRLSRARPEELVEEATTDAYGESEQAVGFYTMMENDLAMPFSTQVLGVEVTVEKVDMPDADEIIAICKSGAKRQTIPILDLPLPSPPPKGAEWIAAYRSRPRIGRCGSTVTESRSFGGAGSQPAAGLSVPPVHSNRPAHARLRAPRTRCAERG